MKNFEICNAKSDISDQHCTVLMIYCVIVQVSDFRTCARSSFAFRLGSYNLSFDWKTLCPSAEVDVIKCAGNSIGSQWKVFFKIKEESGDWHAGKVPHAHLRLGCWHLVQQTLYMDWAIGTPSRRVLMQSSNTLLHVQACLWVCLCSSLKKKPQCWVSSMIQHVRLCISKAVLTKHPSLSCVT